MTWLTTLFITFFKTFLKNLHFGIWRFGLLLLPLSFAQAEVQRIISLSPGTTELVATAGGLNRLVGVVAFSDFPPAVKSLPIIGNATGLNIEEIIQLQPDLIVAWQGGNRLKDLEILQQLAPKLGFKIITINADNLFEIPNLIKQLEILIHPNGYENSQVSQLQSLLIEQTQRYQSRQSVSVFYQIWQTPLMTIGAEQFISQAIRVCGGQNIYHDLKLPAAEVGMESLLQRNPQVILLGGENAFQQDWFKQWQAWPQIKAVKNQQIHFLDADSMQRPTARLIHYLPKLCRIIDSARTSNSQP